MEPIITYSLFHVLEHKIITFNNEISIYRLRNISKFSDVGGV